jgi:hypothetical protein
VRFENLEVSELWPERSEGPKRGEVMLFSEKSRQRLRLSLAKVDQRRSGRPIFGTLTYPMDFPVDAEIFKRHLKMFSQRFIRAFPDAGFHWKLEFQERGAPHFHPIFWKLSNDHEFMRRFRAWLACSWFEIVGSGDERHLRAGTSADVVESQLGIIRYVSGYVSKSDQSKPGFRVGRYWGIVNRTKVPWAKEVVVDLSSGEGKLVRRIARRYLKAVNRKRRVRHAERWLSAESLFNGDVRKLRKERPQLNMFEHFPPKLRLKNNRNVNVFCDAEFWAAALSQLIPALRRTCGPALRVRGPLMFHEPGP